MLSRLLTIFTTGWAGTAAMTACSYAASRITGQNFREPELLARTVFQGHRIPDPLFAGWLLHVGFGLSWAVVEMQLVEKTRGNSRFLRTLGPGILSGATAILLWKLLFRRNPDQPDSSIQGFFLHLVLVHIVYTFAFTETERRVRAPHDSGSDTHAFASSNCSSV